MACETPIDTTMLSTLELDKTAPYAPRSDSTPTERCRRSNTPCGWAIWSMPALYTCLLEGHPQLCPRIHATTWAVGIRSIRSWTAFEQHSRLTPRLPYTSPCVPSLMYGQRDKIDPRQHRASLDKSQPTSWHPHPTPRRRHRRHDGIVAEQPVSVGGNSFS